MAFVLVGGVNGVGGAGFTGVSGDWTRLEGLSLPAVGVFEGSSADDGWLVKVAVAVGGEAAGGGWSVMLASARVFDLLSVKSLLSRMMK